MLEDTKVVNQNVEMIGVTAFARAIGKSEDTVRELERKKVIEAQRDSANRRQFGHSQIAIARAYYAKRDAA
jgi:hypothetical protein